MARKRKKSTATHRRRQGKRLGRKRRAVKAQKRTGLLERERRFVECFMGRCKGNATKAALLAGYSKATAEHQASRLLGKVGIKKAIKERVDGDPNVLERKDLQQLWTKIALGRKPYVKAYLKDRLRASELLGKTHGMFMWKGQIDVGDDLATLLGKPLPKYTAK